MVTNLMIISNVVADIVYVPLFLLPSEKQKENIAVLRRAFQSLQEVLVKESLLETQVGKHTQTISILLRGDHFNEYKLLHTLTKLIQSIKLEDQSRGNMLSKLIGKAMERAEPFWLAEEIHTAKSNTLNIKDIKEHDRKILSNDMQLYALDYFLYMYKLLKECTFDNRKKLLFHGYKDLPSLVNDALQEDMLKKIVYNLWDYNIRYQMIKDYYQYKMRFLPITKNESKISDKEIQEVINALQTYCSSLARISLENGILVFGRSLHFSYGKEVNFEEIIKFLS